MDDLVASESPTDWVGAVINLEKTVWLFRVIVPVNDLNAAVAFYSTILGIEGERVANRRHYFHCGATILACVDPSGEGLDFRPNLDHIYFAVPDLDVVYERAKSAGCSWLEDEIKTRPWDERSVYARDPFGNPICFVDVKTVFKGGRFVE